MVSRPKVSSSNDKTPQKESKPSNVFTLLEIQNLDLKDGADHQNEEDSELEASSDKENSINRKPRETKKKSKKPSGKGKKTQKPKKSESTQLAIKNPITDLDMFTPKNEYEMSEEEEEEYLLMVYFFWKDFNQIRLWLQEKFCDYQDGLCSLIEVSVVTNTAFDLFQRLEQNKLRAMPDFDFEEEAMFFFCEGGLPHVDYDALDRKHQSEEKIDDDLGEEWDWLCLDTYK